MSTKQHKTLAPESVRLAIVTVSTTRSLLNDKSGKWIKKEAGKKHDVVLHQVIPDDKDVIEDMVRTIIYEYAPHAILMTGGTGVSSSDVTIEAVRPMFAKELSAFGPLFAQLSYKAIHTAALLSRATAGVVNRTIVFCLPGSLEACELACNELIFPELGHLVKHLREI